MNFSPDPFGRRATTTLPDSPAALVAFDREMRPLLRAVARRMLRAGQRRPAWQQAAVDRGQQLEQLSADLLDRLLRMPGKETVAAFADAESVANRK